MRRFRIGLMMWLVLLLAGCDRSATPDPLPTPITPEALMTAVVLTQNAPPPGFETISFPAIDENLEALSGWHYEVLMRFEGVFARTVRETRASTRAEVWFNQIASSRRVVAEVEGNLGSLDEEATGETQTYEVVQLGDDVFTVRDGLCFPGDEVSALVPDLRAGTLIGGVTAARVVPRIERINNEEVWRYEFTADALTLPNIRFGDAGQILAMSGEMWVAPQHNAVVRYYLNLEVENANIFGSTLPVTGAVFIRYDLLNVGEQPNITVPFGC